MPPRFQTFQRLGPLGLCLRPAAKPSTPSLLPITQTANISQKEDKRRQRLEPYKWQQAQQRKAANTKRQEEIQSQRDAKWGDPVHGIPTPFVESFDSAGQNEMSTPEKDEDGNNLTEPYELPRSPELLNHMLTRKELDDAIQHAHALSKPVKNEIRNLVDPVGDDEAEQKHQENHTRAVEVLRRIASLSNASAKMRKHTNIRRCIDEFGRHNTDHVLLPKPPSIHPNQVPMPGRSGPDTGSSEVQIAILTVKIRQLAKELETTKGIYKDKHNKRNLRILCHRRQKLLKYMEGKERGSERWTNMLEKLGLSPATWKEQISV